MTFLICTYYTVLLWLRYLQCLFFVTEFAAKRPPFSNVNNTSNEELIENFDPARHHPVFFGVKHKLIAVDDNAVELFDPALSHPACVGYTLLNAPASTTANVTNQEPDKMKCKVIRIILVFECHISFVLKAMYSLC